MRMPLSINYTKVAFTKQFSDGNQGVRYVITMDGLHCRIRFEGSSRHSSLHDLTSAVNVHLYARTHTVTSDSVIYSHEASW